MVVDHFCGWVAEHYDDSAAETFDQAVVQPVVDPLADLTGPTPHGSWAPAPSGSPSRRACPPRADRRAVARHLDPVPVRVAAELDLMARLAGMALEARWGGWDRQPFTNENRSHVSVWRTPG